MRRDEPVTVGPGTDADLASMVATEAGGLLLRLRGALSGTSEADRRYEGDRRSHAFIAARLAIARPHDAILPEEALDAGGQHEWDSAAPVAVAVGAGLHASRIDGSALVYNRPDPLLPDLLVCRAELASRALAAVREWEGREWKGRDKSRLSVIVRSSGRLAPSPAARDGVASVGNCRLPDKELGWPA